ncbi:type II toxin-antitoxin system VapC family toxin [Mucilaginibacter sp. AW1-7]|uniref:type II toxin-antitoxin system VapC family toxin n=1 Tax=unclassified Mucilaginibacter TaxID=2617802 RepID=UPI0023671406|nr:PIN domain-containing protein [Mucilaginibacter sp. KACC 22773]WDF78836.1 PIN domain-containing protein [Mucilaginibacter sp. KACC 22773]
MNLLFDTNIILILIRSNNYDDIIGLLNPDSVPIYISVVSEAEIKSIAIQNNWGINRRNKLNLFLDNVNIVEISQMFVNTYTEIDSYSQCRNPAFVDYPFSTHRNMGKNDLWIASLAALLGLQLVTTDGDFDHLNGVFFDVQKLTPTL